MQRKKINFSSIVIIDIELASQMKKDLKFCFSLLWPEQLHSNISGACLSVFVSITVVF